MVYATSLWSAINATMSSTQYLGLPSCSTTTLSTCMGTSISWFTGFSLKPDEVYSLTAVLLYWSGIIKETDVMDAKSLPQVHMPSRDHYLPDRPEYKPNSPNQEPKP